MTSYRTDQSGTQMSRDHWDKNNSVKKNNHCIYFYGENISLIWWSSDYRKMRFPSKPQTAIA